MRLALKFASCIAVILLLSGCWNKLEINDWMFVQAAAIDFTKEGKYLLTTHFYKPTNKGTQNISGAPSASHYNIRTRGDTLFEAIRDIVTFVGRKAQWSHMRVILIGEEAVKQRDIAEIVDFFSRDHEPRGTILVMITHGKASDYLEDKPVFEQTLGQELLQSQMFTYIYAGKTVETMLIELLIQLRSQSGVAMLPYVRMNKLNPQVSDISGIAFTKKGKLAAVMTDTAKAESMIMLKNEFQHGILEIPCTDGSANAADPKKESVEILSLDTRITPVLDNGKLLIRIHTAMKGSAGELHCSSLNTKEEEQQYGQRIRQTLEQQLRSAVEWLQKEKLDALGLADRLFRADPSTWKSLQDRWEKLYADAQIEVHVDASVIGTGMIIGKPSTAR